MVARTVWDREVAGSIPVSPTQKNEPIFGFVFLCLRCRNRYATVGRRSLDAQNEMEGIRFLITQSESNYIKFAREQAEKYCKIFRSPSDSIQDRTGARNEMKGIRFLSWKSI